MRKKIFIGIAILFIGFGGYYGYLVYQFTDFMDDLGECGMLAGLIYGDSIYVEVEHLKLEQQLEIPEGQGSFGMLNLANSLPPKLIKFDGRGGVIWAVEFKEDASVGIPYRRLSEMELIVDRYGNRLSFFNQSYSEPGLIYLNDQFDVMYMCLSPM